jgi:2-methylcitrate dehydratase
MSETKARDPIQDRLTDYACGLTYEALTPEAAHAAKVRIIDTLGALMAGYFAEPCRIARNLAAAVPSADGATVIGSRMKTLLDMAAFTNCVTARYPELTDGYVWPGSFGGHPSDTITSLLSVGEYTHANGRDYIAAVVLAYEIYTRFSDFFDNLGFDHATFNCLATAVATGRLLGLDRDQLAHCISMAIVPNNVLRQVRIGHMSMFKAAASGNEARAGVFAALLAQAGMEGPHLPFVGKAGWCDHVALKKFSLDTLGGNGTPYKILDTSIKVRPCSGFSMASVLAAEQVAPLRNSEVKKIVVEVHDKALDRAGSGEHRWNPDSRETADHSVPYNVAAVLYDGTITLKSFDDAHLWNADLRALMKKVECVENPDYTKAFRKIPSEHCSRVTVTTMDGRTLVGKSGGDSDDMGAKKSDALISDKFRRLSEDLLGGKRVDAILEQLWRLETMDDVGVIPPQFVLD